MTRSGCVMRTPARSAAGSPDLVDVPAVPFFGRVRAIIFPRVDAEVGPQLVRERLSWPVYPHADPGTTAVEVSRRRSTAQNEPGPRASASPNELCEDDRAAARRRTAT